MRKTLDRYYDKEHRPLVVDKSIVRWNDNLYVYHGAWVDQKTGKIKVLVSSRTGGKMHLIHDRHRHKIELEYTMA